MRKGIHQKEGPAAGVPGSMASGTQAAPCHASTPTARALGSPSCPGRAGCAAGGATGGRAGPACPPPHPACKHMQVHARPKSSHGRVMVCSLGTGRARAGGPCKQLLKYRQAHVVQDGDALSKEDEGVGIPARAMAGHRACGWPCGRPRNTSNRTPARNTKESAGLLSRGPLSPR